MSEDLTALETRQTLLQVSLKDSQLLPQQSPRFSLEEALLCDTNAYTYMVRRCYPRVARDLDDRFVQVNVRCWYDIYVRILLFLPHRRLAHRDHFERREGMKVGGMFKSPMTIIMVLSMVMMFFLPKMMENLDPEQLEVSVAQHPRERADWCISGDAQGGVSVRGTVLGDNSLGSIPPFFPFVADKTHRYFEVYAWRSGVDIHGSCSADKIRDEATFIVVRQK